MAKFKHQQPIKAPLVYYKIMLQSNCVRTFLKLLIFSIKSVAYFSVDLNERVFEDQHLQSLTKMLTVPKTLILTTV